MRRLTVCAAGLALGALTAALYIFPDNNAREQGERYCRMVWIHKQDARYGWPDYEHVYDSQCRADGTLNEKYVRGR